MFHRKSPQSFARRLGYGTEYAPAVCAGSWWPPSGDADRALFDQRPVTPDDALAGGVTDFRARDGILQNRVSAHELVEAKLAAGSFVDEDVDVRAFPGFVASVG